MRSTAMLVLLAVFACADEEEKRADSAGQGAALPDREPVAAPSAAASAPTPATGSGSPAADQRRTGPCADFAACRDACTQRRSGACVRMHDQVRKGDEHRAESEKTAARMCDAGHAEACHVRHVQLQADRRRSAQALTRACDLGYGQACLSLAGRTRAAAKADELRKRGMFQLDRFCQRDDAYACTALGDVARSPADGEEADLARARWHYDKGCKLDDGDACYAMAGQIAGQQPSRAVALLDRACELGEPRACARVGDHYAAGDQVMKNMERAAGAWQMACDSGADLAYRACDSLADALSDGRLPRDDARAGRLRQRGAELASQFEGD